MRRSEVQEREEKKEDPVMKRSAFKMEDLGSEGSLKIRLDYSFATQWPLTGSEDDPPLSIFFSSHLRFPKPVDVIPPGQLRRMAEIAHKEMTTLCKKYGFAKKDIPRKMTLLARGNDILLGSSQKGNSFTYRGSGQSQVRKWMDDCQHDLKRKNGGQPRHQHDGKCGEQMVAHLYYLIHNEPLAEQKARVITVSNWSVYKPCEGSEEVSHVEYSTSRLAGWTNFLILEYVRVC